MKTNFSVLFFLKKPRNQKIDSDYFIYHRITLNGRRWEGATGKKTASNQWNPEAGKLHGKSQQIKTTNAFLDNLKAKFYSLYHDLRMDGIDFDITTFKNRYLGITDAGYTLCDAIRLHNTKMQTLVECGEYAIGTLKRFQVLFRHIESFIEVTYQKADIDLKDLDQTFIDDFEFYLRSIKLNDINTSNKHLKNLKKIILICVRYKWIDGDPFDGRKLQSKPVNRTFLTADELRRIDEKELTTQRLEQVRDFFLFSCYTGLSYADVHKLQLTDIGVGVDGGKWIFTYRQKTDTRVSIPLLPVASNILAKYAENPWCVHNNRALPVSSNQKMNEYLVEIAAICGINKTLGNRVAKRTFATTVTLMNGVPIESVSKMLGHTNIRTTQLYAKVLDKKVSEDMAPLMKKFAAHYDD
ncbi:site-specific integrase [Sphingobacterium sp. UME9]|uniref:site-specific integrase n=1 Tax=Sphingobacterium sp. UME9 TaxID=1862316 RepID=UPI0016038133|nr:site-specific integrase [Sphingobacterium sp. UME9]MBB1643615.1 recombinase [Sphingobacterium sp. UME9]